MLCCASRSRHTALCMLTVSHVPSSRSRPRFGHLRPATRLRPPSTSLQQHVRCEMVILRIPISGDLRAVTALGCVRGCVFARNYAVVECSQSHIDYQSWRRCVGLPQDAVGSQQMVFQRHIFRGRACEDRREHCGPASGPTSKFEASTTLARMMTLGFLSCSTQCALAADVGKSSDEQRRCLGAKAAGAPGAFVTPR